VTLRMSFQGFNHLGVILLFHAVAEHRPAQRRQRARPALRKPSGLQLDRRLATLLRF
jgi:hypothetical protein